MHLLELKEKRGESWKALEKLAGVPRGNLCKIAHGTRGFDVETGWKLKRLGVSLDDQVEIIAARRGWRTPGRRTASQPRKARQ